MKPAKDGKTPVDDAVALRRRAWIETDKGARMASMTDAVALRRRAWIETGSQ